MTNSKMDDFKERLKRLKEQRRQASHSNFKAVLEENEQAKRPANWEKRRERDLKNLQLEEAKQQAEASGQDFEIVKSLNYRADEIDRWEKYKSNKKRHSSEGVVDFEEGARRQYERSMKQLKPDTDKQNESEKGIVSDERLKIMEGSCSDQKQANLIRDDAGGVERMVADTHKQIEIRSKRSRRRKFDDEADVNYINERNMKFNKKLERFYGSYTEEIKQNFERGTAM